MPMQGWRQLGLLGGHQTLPGHRHPPPGRWGPRPPRQPALRCRSGSPARPDRRAPPRGWGTGRVCGGYVRRRCGRQRRRRRRRQRRQGLRRGRHRRWGGRWRRSGRRGRPWRRRRRGWPVHGDGVSGGGSAEAAAEAAEAAEGVARGLRWRERLGGGVGQGSHRPEGRQGGGRGDHGGSSHHGRLSRPIPCRGGGERRAASSGRLRPSCGAHKRN